MSDANVRTPIDHLRSLLADGDVRGALKYLNSRTPHRFTGLYRFEDPVLANVNIVDKRDPDALTTPDVPLTATFCAFTRPKNDTLRIGSAPEDESAEDYPTQTEIRSYCGVPLVDEDGNVFGTICHFDYDTVEISEESVALLEAMAPLLCVSRDRVMGAG